MVQQRWRLPPPETSPPAPLPILPPPSPGEGRKTFLSGHWWSMGEYDRIGRNLMERGAVAGDYRARQLRKEATDAERVLWESLRGRRLQGLKFLRQYPIGPFI